MPFRPGTGIPNGISSFAFDAGAADAGNSVGGVVSPLAGFDSSSVGVGVGLAWGAFGIREAGRLGFRVFLGCCCVG
jgi:hypothetical protein